MLTTLHNACLTLTVSDKGAEMQSLRSAEGIDYLWDGNPAYWSGRAPHLFPIVGALRDDRADSEAGPVRLPKHGFIRRAQTQLVQASDTVAVYRCTSDAETLEGYPYPFVWSVRYELQEREVQVTYTVENTGDRPMPYCIGGHPGFRVQLGEGEEFEDTVLEWEYPETVNCPQIDLVYCLIEDNHYNRLVTDKNQIHLSHVLFRADALIFENMKSKWLQLRGPSGHGVRVTSDMPYWGVWSPGDDAPLVCIEPWTGMGTRTSEDNVLEHKLGMRRLPAGESATHRFSILTF